MKIPLGIIQQQIKQASLTEYLIDYYSESNYDSYGPINNTYTSIGQTFACGRTAKISKVKFYIEQDGTYGSFVAKLWALTGTYGTDAKPTGSVLATSNAIASADFPTTYTLVEFTFPSAQQYEMQNGVKYGISLTQNSYGAQVKMGRDASSSTHSGNYFYYGSSWAASNARDYIFYVYGLA